MPAVIDSNVLATANAYADHASMTCVEACIAKLISISEGDILLIDDGLRWFEEYRGYATLAGQPGPGDAFLKWAFQNQANERHCRIVPIHPRNDDPSNFVEFPADPDLATFDRSDRKWVAIALASEMRPPIVNATDNDWMEYREPLERNGILIDFLCPDMMNRNRLKAH